ncbi:hypothetical protein NPIL_617781 [Nephila pilipes]|uniref:Mos1 transposase HTH domain-containing protein n=1 Tax=Nephila pilipes TaxID=299642 RepID=A0A8X6PFV2_NEPPI|nr:hypothetical protein NPIL_617781 [Nephila pilipes]
MELNREHFRAIIFHNFRRGLSRQECFDELNSLYSDKAPSYSTVKNWYNEFNRGRCSIQDESRAGSSWTSKQMIACFFGINGHVATVALEQRRTVNSEWYTTICLPEVIGEIRKKQKNRRIILHHDNASSHTSTQTKAFLTERKIELMGHPPTSVTTVTSRVFLKRGCDPIV